MPRFLFFMGLVLITVMGMLTGCKKPENSQNGTHTNADTPKSTVQSNLAGCYTITQGEPAILKVSHAEGKWTMQMKEPNKDKPWDNPEPLSPISVNEGWQYFAVNAIGLDKQNVTHILVRPDRVMALAQLDTVAKNLNPQLDSDFVMYLLNTSNTVYQVACDDIPVDIIGEGSLQKIHGGL